MKNIPTINHARCTLCKKCIEVCPKDIIRLADSKIQITEDECLLCSHCYCVCAFDAVYFENSILKKSEFLTFSYNEKVISPGESDAEEIVNLLRSRRSIRKYTDRPVDPAVLSDLVECAVTAPSGSNCQDWHFTLVNGRERVWDLALEIRKFFTRLNSMAGNPLIRYLSIPIIGKALLNYYNNNYESVETALEKAAEGIDLLFHSAPSLIIIHGPMDGSTPVEDAQFASYNMTILAHALGYGTCYIGYAVESINREKKIKKFLNIPIAHRIHTVLTVGYPDSTYQNLALRKPYKKELIP